MIDIHTENLIRIKEIPKLHEEIFGERINLSTAYRWSQKGLKNAKLATIRAGGKVYTSIEQLEIFFHYKTGGRNQLSSAGPPSKPDPKKIDDASDRLEDEGM